MTTELDKTRDIQESIDCTIRVLGLPQEYEPNDIIDNLKNAGMIQKVKLGLEEMLVTFTTKYEKELSKMYNGCPIGTKYFIRLEEPITMDLPNCKAELYPSMEDNINRLNKSLTSFSSSSDDSVIINNSYYPLKDIVNQSTFLSTKYSTAEKFVKTSSTTEIDYWRRRYQSLEEEYSSLRIKHSDTLTQLQNLQKSKPDNCLLYTFKSIPSDPNSLFHSIASLLESHFYRVCRTPQD
jgi:hypothetical protein